MTEMSARIDAEVHRANLFADTAQNLVIARGDIPANDRNNLLLGYWSLGFELHRGILCLIYHKFYAPAFALVRPLVEAVIRGHVVLIGSDEDIKNIRADEYRTDFSKIGKVIDEKFGIAPFFENFLSHAKEALHGYTHSGMHQIGRRFKGGGLEPNFSEGEVIEVIHTSASAAFLLNNLVTKHFEFEKEWEENNRLYIEWGGPPDSQATQG